MIEIIPAVMPDSFEDLTDKVGAVAPYVSHVQLDIMDGKFVKSRSWPYFSADRLSFHNVLHEIDGLPYWEKVNFEVDLMVLKPEDVVEDWVTAGAERIIVHVESTKKLEEIVKIIDGRVELALALNIDTPIETILPHLEDIQAVQFMGIARIGFQKEPFDSRVLDKIRGFRNAHPEIIVSVDGGVSLETAPTLLEAGATRLVSGSAIFDSGNVAGAIQAFKNLV